MKRPLGPRTMAPPNMAAKSLRLGKFQPKVATNPKVYNRKVKHRKGHPPELPFSFAAERRVPQNPSDDGLNED